MITLAVIVAGADHALVEQAARLVTDYYPRARPLRSLGERRRVEIVVDLDPDGVIRHDLAAISVMVVPELTRLSARNEGLEWHVAIGPKIEEPQ